MATQQIGLAATLDLTNFNAGVARYLAGINQMTAAANQTGGMGAGISTTNSNASALVSSLDSIGKGFLAVGAAATAAAGGLALFASSSIQMATNFEQGLADIAATMGQTINQITPLADLIKSLAVDPNLKVTLTEAAAASDMLAKSGIHMKEQLGGALRATVLLANATGESFPLSAKVASTAMDAFNVSADKLPQIIDGITGVLNNSRMSLQDYLYVLTNTGGRANQFGIDLGMMNAIMVETRGEFNTGRTQGTAFSEMLRQMTAPTEKGAAIMQKLGINVANADGTFKDIFQIIGEVTKAFKVLSQAEQATAAQEIFGSSGGKMFFALAGQTEENLKNVAVQMNASGQAATAAATRMDTLAGRIEIFQGIIESASLSFGEKFLPMFSAGLDVINQKFSELVMSFQAAGVEGLANALGVNLRINVDYLTTSFYALAGAAGALLVLGTIAATVFALTTAFAALSSPIGMLIAGVALLGAAYATNFLHIRDITYIVIDAFSQMKDAIIADMEYNRNSIENGMQAWLGIFDRGSNAIYEGVSAVFNALPEPVKKAMMYVYDLVTSTMNSAIEYVNSALSSISSAAGGYVPNISLPSLPDLVFPDMAGAGAGLADSFKSLFTMPTITGAPEYIAQIEKVKNATTDAAKVAGDSALDYAEMNSGLLDVETGAKKAGKSVEQMAKDVEAAKEKISDNNLSMANLRGEIAQLEAQYPGLTKEITDNFNAHIAAGNSVASFGDKLGATERRQMFNYLTKLIDMNEANKKLAGSNGLIDKSFGTVEDGFMNLVDTMAKGLNIPTTITISGNEIDYSKFKVVGSLLPPEPAAQPDATAANQAQDNQAASMQAQAAAAQTLNPLLQTMGGIYNQTLNPALQLASTYLQPISLSLAAINETLAVLTGSPLILLSTQLSTMVNPALLATSSLVDILANSSLSNLISVIQSQLLPSLGQIYTVLTSQVSYGLANTRVQSDLLSYAYKRLYEAGEMVVNSSKRIYDAMKTEGEMVQELRKYYEELLKAKRAVTTAVGSTGAPVEGAGGGFASGGQFVVPQGYPSHGAGMPIRVHSGELVKIFTASQTRRMAGQSKHIQSSSSTDNSKNITFNLTTNTSQPSKSIVSDFNLMKARAGVF